jgi:hypothetical protein
MGNDEALSALADMMSPLSRKGGGEIDWDAVAPAIIEQVAERLVRSPPTSRARGEIRFHARGSLKINTETGRWYDHEAGVGGGLLDLPIHLGGVSSRAEAVEWLRREGFLTTSGAPSAAVASTPVKRTNGAGVNLKPVAQYKYTDEDGNVLLASTV